MLSTEKADKISTQGELDLANIGRQCDTAFI